MSWRARNDRDVTARQTVKKMTARQTVKKDDGTADS